jgi:hypothetical protein
MSVATEVELKELSFLEAINEALAEEMRRDERVFVLGEDVVGGAARKHLEQDDAWGGVMGVTRGLVREFGRRRVRDTPISEAGFVGAAVGAAALGLRPVVELVGGTATLSNLGGYPVDLFTPVLFGPQICLVATGRIRSHPVVKSEAVAVEHRIWVNVCIDHRAADGDAGGRLLAALEEGFASLG